MSLKPEKMIWSSTIYDLIDDEPIMEGSDDFEDLAVENASYTTENRQDASTISPMPIPNSPIQPPPISTCLPTSTNSINPNTNSNTDFYTTTTKQ